MIFLKSFMLSFYIIKIIQSSCEKDFDIFKAKPVKEIKAMKKLEHKHIIKYITCWLELENYCKSQKEDKKDSDSNLEEVQKPEVKSEFPIYFFIQTEFHSFISLKYYLKNRTNELSKAVIFCIFRQIFKAVHYIHSQGLTHRHLKPKNILINEKFRVKICNFGINHSSEEEKMLEKSLYLPNEINEENYFYESTSDIYSLGVTLYDTCFYFENEEERIRALKNIQDEKYELPKNDQFSEWILELCKKMTRKERKNRIKIDETISEFIDIFASIK